MKYVRPIHLSGNIVRHLNGSDTDEDSAPIEAPSSTSTSTITPEVKEVARKTNTETKATHFAEGSKVVKSNNGLPKYIEENISGLFMYSEIYSEILDFRVIDAMAAKDCAFACSCQIVKL